MFIHKIYFSKCNQRFWSLENIFHIPFHPSWLPAHYLQPRSCWVNNFWKNKQNNWIGGNESTKYLSFYMVTSSAYKINSFSQQQLAYILSRKSPPCLICSPQCFSFLESFSLCTKFEDINRHNLHPQRSLIKGWETEVSTGYDLRQVLQTP